MPEDMTIRPRLAVAVYIVGCAAVLSAQGVPTPLPDRARAAERVVVGRVASSQSVWRVNEQGDRLIVSVLRVVAGETLKGAGAPAIDVEVEGGTIGDLTLKVSDLPALVPGDRAVFYLRRNVGGAMVPHGRGEGILKLDTSDRVPGTSLTLDEVRRTVRAAAGP